MSTTSRIFGFLAYLLLIVGGLLIVLLRRKDAFAMHHARQSLVLTLVILLTPVVWAATSWLLVLIPFAGPLTAASNFALVISAYVGVVIAWIMGMSNALRGKQLPIPFFGQWAG